MAACRDFPALLIAIGCCMVPGASRGAAQDGGPVAVSSLTALRNGDANADFLIDLGDVLHLYNHLYLGGPPPARFECGTEVPDGQNGDVNGDRTIDLADGVHLLNFVFEGGTTPVAIRCLPAEVPPAPCYVFKPLAFLGDPAPGGGSFDTGFRAAGLNNRSQVVFGAGLMAGGEGIFTRWRQGKFGPIALPHQPAPGGGLFGGLPFLGAVLNDPGDSAFNGSLEGAGLPVGFNAGIYYLAHSSGELSAVVAPGVTEAPGGGVFAGAAPGLDLGNGGDIVFAGIITGADIDPASPPGVDGLGVGVFLKPKQGSIESVVRPGDPAPGGGVFDFAAEPAINNGGDIAFGGHLAGEGCADSLGPQSGQIGCWGSVYLRVAATGEIISVAGAGDPVPGGGTFGVASKPALNAGRDIVFTGDLDAQAAGIHLGLFLRGEGGLTAVARPGDPLPGGGSLARAGGSIGSYRINNRGDVAFSASIEGGDSGIFVWSNGELRLVARSGTEIIGLGVIVELELPAALDPGSIPIGFNEHQQVLFSAAIDDASGSLKGVLLLATPRC